MKNIYIAALLLLSPLSSVQADNKFSDLSAQLSAVAKSAYQAISKQSAIKVNLAGKQRMLTQKMTKEFLLITLNIEPDENKKKLEKTIALFEKTLIGLQKGDKSFGLSETKAKDTLEQLQIVTSLWKDFKPQISSILKQEKTDKALQYIFINNLVLLKEMNKAVSLYEMHSGADLNELAAVINLSGRQRMLTQKMSKELLLIAQGIDKTENKGQLKKTIQLFDSTLKGLIEGNNELPATTDKKILAQLAIVKGLWGKFKPIIEASDTGAEPLKKIADMNLPLLSAMNKAVKMYEVRSKVE